MRMTSWFCAGAPRRPPPPWPQSRPGWWRTACVCIRRRPISATAGKPGQGFEFLGYRFEAGQRWVRKKSLDRLKDKIRARTRRTCGQSFPRIIDSLNPVLKGWFAYFQHANPYTFRMLDQFIRRRLRSILLKQTMKQSGYGLSRATHQRWPNSFFAEAGLLALHTAWLNARHSR